MKKQEMKRYSLVGNVLYFWRLFWENEPSVVILSVVEILLAAAVPFAGIWLPKLTIDLVMSNVSVSKILWTMLAFSAGMFFLYGSYHAISRGKYHIYNMQRTNFMAGLFLKSLRIKYADVESGEIKQRYWKAMRAFDGGDWSASSKVVSDTVLLLINLLRFLLYSTVLSTLSISLAAALTGISFLGYLIRMYEIRFEEGLHDEMARLDKHYYYLASAMGDTNAAKDIRIFGMGKWLRKLLNQALKEKCALQRCIQNRKTVCEQITFFISAIRDLAVYGYLISQVLQEAIAVSDFVLYFGAVTGFSGFVSSIMDGFAGLREASGTISEYRSYMELAEQDENAGTRHISELTNPPEIEFLNVSFSYQEKPLFEHFNLTIHAGEKLAVVGVNGAGKTTLVKLLCGLYEPDEGEIRIGGIDIRCFPKSELYQLFSVVFQEPFILPFTIGENLSMQKAGKLNVKKAWEALEKAGLKQIFEEKQIDMDSFMKKTLMENGVELSGGQQQRFLLARALYKEAPVMILDEPTAALDPIAESEVYQCYRNSCKEKTALFISHRLASTRFSDRIVMLEQGKIIEAGTHEELMQKGGAYAQMYQVQSNYYEEKEDCIDGNESYE